MNELNQCNHDKSEIRKRIFSNGGVQFVKQCLVCGHAISNPIAKTSIDSIDEIKDFDNELKEEWDKLWHKLYKENREKEKEEQKKEFFEWYKKYLQSKEWKLKSKRVLYRENYICQGCRENEATIAHHTTYEHVGNEFLFELIALCQECHERYHNSVNEPPNCFRILNDYAERV